MARRKITLNDKIKQQEQVVFKIKDKYDAAIAELDRLLTKRRELESKELLKAFEKSNRSLDEILAFLKGDGGGQDD